MKMYGVDLELTDMEKFSHILQAGMIVMLVGLALAGVVAMLLFGKDKK